MTVSPDDLTHAMLVAVLMDSGGSLTIPADAFEPDSLGGPDGSWHTVTMEPRHDGRIRLSVCPRRPGDAAGVRYE
ncbi:pRL2-19 [Streptomyces sp. Isolate_45]|uniref:pRL2-19 n=1 Tax=Streptomyces sp. Isolate_45 TaxID=2950111 RepID=UPI002481B661|nr:pRL2-19 [Streptomyces sp. Isolate_45]MDA5284739.1 pRL2-19 [Streptomyces sp. Isolate_45]